MNAHQAAREALAYARAAGMAHIRDRMAEDDKKAGFENWADARCFWLEAGALLSSGLDLAECDIDDDEEHMEQHLAFQEAQAIGAP